MQYLCHYGGHHDHGQEAGGQEAAARHGDSGRQQAEYKTILGQGKVREIISSFRTEELGRVLPSHN